VIAGSKRGCPAGVAGRVCASGLFYCHVCKHIRRKDLRSTYREISKILPIPARAIYTGPEAFPIVRRNMSESVWVMVAGTLRTLDLNLLKVFEAVLRHRRVSGAANELGVTPSAVSHALGRLRRIFEDDLFVFGASGMEATSRAIQLGTEIRASLDRILNIVERRPFDPAQSQSVFSIAACEYAAAVIIPPMVRAVTAAAPGVGLHIHPLNRSDVVQRLDDGRLSLAFGQFGHLPARMRRSTLLREREAILVRSEHPLANGDLTPDRLLGFSHAVALFSSSDDEGSLQGLTWIERLQERVSCCARRHVALRIAQFSTVLSLVASSDMVVTLPQRLALWASREHNLAMLELPSDPLEVEIQMIWHERSSRDEGCQWLMRYAESSSG
jgi:DNA-binding transcriptional LysR family regulator